MFDAKAEKMSVHHEAKAKTETMFDGKAETMSVHHVAKSKTEKIDDAKALKMSVQHVAKAKTETMLDGKAGNKHLMPIHHETKATKGALVHDSVFQLRN